MEEGQAPRGRGLAIGLIPLVSRYGGVGDLRAMADPLHSPRPRSSIGRAADS